VAPPRRAASLQLGGRRSTRFLEAKRSGRAPLACLAAPRHQPRLALVPRIAVIETRLRSISSGRSKSQNKLRLLAMNPPLLDASSFAARQGNASAELDVGYAYEKGIAVPADPGEAFRWYLQAANQGNTTAQFNLTEFYSHGTAGTVDKSQTERWSAKMWEVRNQHAQVCSSLPVKDTISRVELISVRDGAGELLTRLTQAMTGVDVKLRDARPELVLSEGTDQVQSYGRFHIDMGMQTGDFLCHATFLRGHRKDCGDDDPSHPGIAICTDDDAGVDTKLTEAGAIALLKTYPVFYEVFRIRLLADGRYQITLVPTSIQLSQTYSGTTAAR
jgi:Sel1 repeat